MKLLPGLLLILFLPVVFAQEQSAPPANSLTPLVQLLGESDDAQFQLDILKGMNDGLNGRRGVQAPGGWEAVAQKLGRSPNAQVRELTKSLSVTFGSSAAVDGLRSTLLDASAGVAARSNALASLLQAKDAQLVPVLHQLFKDPLFRIAALRGAAAFEDSKTPAAILQVYPSLTASEKNAALSTLSSRISYAKALLAAVEKDTVPTKDLTADIVRQLRTLKDPAINDQVAKNWGVARETEASKVTEIAQLKALVQSKGYGNAQRGRVLFTKVCQQCHTLFGEGGKVGPEITGANRNDLDYLLQNIVDPNAIIPNDYRTWNVDTKDDRSITGIVTKQDENSITIITANETIVIPRKDVLTVKQTELSMMPEGLLQPLMENEIRDLLGYLRSPAQVALPPEVK